MQIIPAIDLLDGNVVRLRKGAESTAQVYSTQPWKIARSFQEAGVSRIHIVDLDGAFGRQDKNRSTIERIIKQVDIPVQLGGGIRSLDAAVAYFKMGVNRIILGSIAVSHADLVRRIIQQCGPDRVIVGIDARDGKVTTHGWTKESTRLAIGFAREMSEMGVVRFIITDIDTDGMLCGIQPQMMMQIAHKTGAKVIASGGVATLDDIKTLVDVGGDIIEGVVIGRAIYEKQLDLREAVQYVRSDTNQEASCS